MASIYDELEAGLLTAAPITYPTVSCRLVMAVPSASPAPMIGARRCFRRGGLAGLGAASSFPAAATTGAVELRARRSRHASLLERTTVVAMCAFLRVSQNVSAPFVLGTKIAAHHNAIRRCQLKPTQTRAQVYHA